MKVSNPCFSSTQHAYVDFPYWKYGSREFSFYEDTCCFICSEVRIGAIGRYRGDQGLEGVGIEIPGQAYEFVCVAGLHIG